MEILLVGNLAQPCHDCLEAPQSQALSAVLVSASNLERLSWTSGQPRALVTSWSPDSELDH